jgi:hypothetical protein
MPSTIFGPSPVPSICAQLSDVADSDSPDSRQLIVIKWRGRRFTPDSLVAKKGARGRSSWIQQEGGFLRELLGTEH